MAFPAWCNFPSSAQSLLLPDNLADSAISAAQRVAPTRGITAQIAIPRKIVKTVKLSLIRSCVKNRITMRRDKFVTVRACRAGRS